MTSRMLSIRKLKLVEFRIGGSSLLHSIVFKVVVLDIHLRDVISIPSVINIVIEGTTLNT